MQIKLQKNCSRHAP